MTDEKVYVVILTDGTMAYVKAESLADAMKTIRSK